jgi:ribonucleoside-diphosphate reductase beta chain
MMMTAFAAMETVHIAAYSHLLDTIGMPESEYSAFMKYKEMKDKYDYMQNFDMSSKKDIALTVAVFSHLLRAYNYLLVLQFCLTFQDTTK